MFLCDRMLLFQHTFVTACVSRHSKLSTSSIQLMLQDQLEQKAEQQPKLADTKLCVARELWTWTV